MGASDFTHMNDLQVTLAGQPFDHMIYHFVLTYSNWETGIRFVTLLSSFVEESNFRFRNSLTANRQRIVQS